MNGDAVDEAAFDTMSTDAKLGHIYHRVVSIENAVNSAAQSSQEAADAAGRAQSYVDAKLREHSSGCLTARKEEAAAVDKSQTKYMSVIVLLVGLLCTAIGWGLAG